MTTILIAIKNEEKIKRWNNILINSTTKYEFIVHDSEHTLKILDKNKNILTKVDISSNKTNRHIIKYKNYSISDELFYSGFKTKRQMLIKISNLLNLLDKISLKKYLFLISPGSGSYFYATCHDYFKRKFISAYRVIYNRQFNIDRSANFYITDNNQSTYSSKLPVLSSNMKVKRFYNEVVDKYITFAHKNRINKNRIKYRSSENLLQFISICIKLILKYFLKKNLDYYILRRQFLSTIRKIYYQITLFNNKPIISKKTVVFYLNVFGDAQVNLRNPLFINPCSIQKKLSEKFDTINFKLHPSDLGGLTFKKYFKLKRLNVNFIINNNINISKKSNITVACLNGSIVVENALKKINTLVIGKSLISEIDNNPINFRKVLRHYTCNIGKDDSKKTRHESISNIVDKLVYYEKKKSS